MREIFPGIDGWSVHSPEKGYAFNGYAIVTSDGATALIDPPQPEGGDWSSFEMLAPFHGIYLTNRNHARAAEQFRDLFRTKVFVHEADAAQLPIAADETLSGGELIGGEVVVVPAPGKSPGEVAFHLPGRRALIVGDAVIGVPAGALSTYPEDKIDDQAALRRTTVQLAALDFDALLLCDGEAFLAGGRDALAAFAAGTS